MHMFPALSRVMIDPYTMEYKQESLYIAFHLSAKVTHQLMMATSQSVYPLPLLAVRRSLRLVRN